MRRAEEADPATNVTAAVSRDRAVSVPVDGNRRLYAFSKRSFDLLVASTALVCSAPIWLMAILLIKLTSPGELLYAKTRCGQDGRHFTCYKFRTMVNGADARRHELLHLNEMTGPVFKLSNDPRMTRVGRWLRKTSIDELPQLLNVLRGEMSIVGPRPALPHEVMHYTPQQLGRLTVKPGLTCLWQVSGRSSIDFDRWMELDLEYIRRRSFWYDCWIVLRTIPAVLLAQGAY